MDPADKEPQLHIVITPKIIHRPFGIRKAGQVSLVNIHRRGVLERTPLYWKNTHIHIKISSLSESATLEISEPSFIHLLQYGFQLEIIKNNIPFYKADFGQNPSLRDGFSININVFNLTNKSREKRPHVVLYKKISAITPRFDELYFHNH